MSEAEVLTLIGRDAQLLATDLREHAEELERRVRGRRFLVIGGAGSIGRAVVKELFLRRPEQLDVVDISENGLVELVRDVRSSLGYLDGGFRTFAIDAGSSLFETFFRREGPYSDVLNLSALKHVRSERDPYTLMRMLEVNVLNVGRTLDLAVDTGVSRYFSVSTDKAANPVNLMGASKRLMELLLLAREDELHTSTARFANVAFSDGSLPYGWRRRLEKRQPLSAPHDVRRYFVTETEAGRLCLMAALLAEKGEIFFPKLDPGENLLSFAEIAERFLRHEGWEPHPCDTEEDARGRVEELAARGRWPCYFFASDTTGEKPYEEFLSGRESVDLDRFRDLGVILRTPAPDRRALDGFLEELERLRSRGWWEKGDVVALFERILPELSHVEMGRHLDQRM